MRWRRADGRPPKARPSPDAPATAEVTLLVPRPGVGGPAVRRLLLGSGQVYNLQALTCHLPQKSIRRKTQRKSSRLWGNGETVFFVRARGLNVGPTPPHTHGCAVSPGTGGVSTGHKWWRRSGLASSGSSTTGRAEHSSEDVSVGQRRAQPRAPGRLRKRPARKAPGTPHRHGRHHTGLLCSVSSDLAHPSPRTRRAHSGQETCTLSCFQTPPALSQSPRDVGEISEA